MSYGNYYEMQRDFTESEWNRVLQCTAEIIRRALLTGIKLGYIELTGQKVHIAGIEEETDEHFILEKNGYSLVTRGACITNRKPYDKVVKSILYEARQLAPVVFEGLFCDDEPIYGGYKDRDTIYWQFQNYFKEME